MSYKIVLDYNKEFYQNLCKLNSESYLHQKRRKNYILTYILLYS